DLLDRALVDRREGLFILPPFAAERLLPVGVGLNAVAVADMHGGGAEHPFGGALQRLDAPVADLIPVAVEGGLGRLHRVAAVWRPAAPWAPGSGARRK